MTITEGIWLQECLSGHIFSSYIHHQAAPPIQPLDSLSLCVSILETSFCCIEINFKVKRNCSLDHFLYIHKFITDIYLFLETSSWGSLTSRSESSLRGLPVKEVGDSVTGPAGSWGSWVDDEEPQKLSMESAFSYEVIIFWTNIIPRVWSCEEEEVRKLSWICSCLADSLPCSSTFIKLFFSHSPIFLSILNTIIEQLIAKAKN